jgi:hypothetical protein
MTVYDDVYVEFRQPSAFDTGDPVAVFEDLRVYVEFDSSDHGRRPVEEKFPGHPGEWVCAYSSLERLRDTHGEDIEYSCVLGRTLLGQSSTDAGVWYDRGYRDGRKILLPPAPFQLDDLSDATADLSGGCCGTSCTK